MTHLTFDQSLALSLYQSSEPFPVDLDNAWRWLGYTRIDSCLDTLKNNFEQGIDFSGYSRKTPNGGRPKNCIILTIDCFKSLGMMAGTEQGKAIRKYFLECERIAKQATTKPANSLTLIDTSKLDALVDRESKLQDEVKVLETRLASLRNDLQNIKRDKAAEAKAFAEKYPDVVKYSIKCNQILAEYGDGNKYFSNPLNR
ncbi:MAG: hypothetical protein V7K67_06385 [Nostoc sp.]|uniref:hypothetical protein n=1 Tax=Nostoc sp. TaxID=1180 RepID=UPI002FF81792